MTTFPYYYCRVTIYISMFQGQTGGVGGVVVAGIGDKKIVYFQLRLGRFSCT